MCDGYDDPVGPINPAMFSELLRLLPSAIGRGFSPTDSISVSVIGLDADRHPVRYHTGTKTEKMPLQGLSGMSSKVLAACNEYGELLREVRVNNQGAEEYRQMADSLEARANRLRTDLLLKIWRNLPSDAHTYFGDQQLRVKEENGQFSILDCNGKTVAVISHDIGRPLLSWQHGIADKENEAKKCREVAHRLNREARAIRGVLDSKSDYVHKLVEEWSKANLADDNIAKIRLIFKGGPAFLITRVINEEGGEFSAEEKEALKNIGQDLAARGDADQLPAETRALLGLPVEDAAPPDPDAPETAAPTDQKPNYVMGDG